MKLLLACLGTKTSNFAQTTKDLVSTKCKADYTKRDIRLDRWTILEAIAKGKRND